MGGCILDSQMLERSVMRDQLNIIVLATLYAIFNVVGAAIIKKRLVGVKIDEVRHFIQFLFDPLIFLAFALIMVSMFFAVKGLSLSAFSTFVPLMTGINFALTVSAGALYFNDRLNIYGYVGVVVIIIGVALVGSGYTALADSTPNSR
jgi:multidrug transporter EmrE-like cation transporter